MVVSQGTLRLGKRGELGLWLLAVVVVVVAGVVAVVVVVVFVVAVVVAVVVVVIVRVVEAAVSAGERWRTCCWIPRHVVQSRCLRELPRGRRKNWQLPVSVLVVVVAVVWAGCLAAVAGQVQLAVLAFVQHPHPLPSHVVAT